MSVRFLHLAIAFGLVIGMIPIRFGDALAVGRNGTGADASTVARSLSFEPNLGQVEPDVDFIARGGGFSAFLSRGDAVLALGNGNNGFAIRMGLVGGNNAPEAIPQALQPGLTNYFIGNDPGKWLTDVPTYAAVEYQDVYADIDLRYLGNERQLQYDFIVQPGGDPSQIALRFDGASHLALSADGDLEVGLNPGRTVTFSAPVTYQDVDGERVAVDSAYVSVGDTVSFTVGDYDPSRPLIIDPTLQYGSYLGGTGGDSGSAIALDGSGNIVVAGYSASSDHPVTVGAYDQTANGNNDVVVTKLSADGSTLLWATYLGGSGLDNANDLAIDGSGAVYLGVYTASSNFPTTAGAFDTTLGGLYDGAVAKLSANGASLLYSTYLGGSGANDYLRAIAVDASGQAVVAGATDSNNFPMVGGSYDTTFGGSFDAFVTKVSTTGTGLVWSTYIGGAASDGADDVVLDGSGTVYLTGQAASGFPTTAGAYDSTVGGTFDGHATKLSADGTTLLYATVFGGSASDVARAIAVADANTIFVGGDTPSSDFPTTAGAYDTTKSSSDDMFALSLDLTQTGSAQLAYSTFIGGSGVDRVTGIAVDASNRAHLAGWTQSSGLATVGAYDTTLGGSSDGVLAILSGDGTTMEEMTYIGGDSGESANDVQLSGSSIYLTGNTSSAAGFPITAGAYQSSSVGTSDGFIVKFATLDAPADPSVVTVNSTGNTSDNNIGNGICNTGGTVGGDPECTLRAAIEEANASVTVDTIHFDIPTSDSGYQASPVAFRIRPSGTVLPNITAPVTIEGTTQPQVAPAGRPVIVLDGSIAPTSGDPNGLSLNAGNSTVRGLVIQNFGEDGIEIDVNGGNLIAGNYIGTDATGTLPRPNGTLGMYPVAGVSIKTDGNTIGGTLAADRNIISGNTQFGIALRSSANNNTIVGNYIGVDSTGSSAVGNADGGVLVIEGSANNLIGGTTPGAGNVISANGADGVYLQDAGTDGNIIRGNYIGTDATGLLDRGNADRGVQVESGADNTVIGGSAAGAGNVISGNGNDGIVIGDGASPGTGTTGTVVQGNLIGVGSDSTTPMGNDAHGVHLTTVDANLIGGTAAGAGNTIAHNTWTGVLIQNSTASANSILGNAIHSNGGIGIDLGDNGVSDNDSGDGDSGANDLLNFPMISSATEAGGTVTVTFDLDVPANPDQYRIEFFANPSGADGSGNGEGEVYLSAITTVPGTGLTHTFSGSVGDVITATATRIDSGATSGFSSTSEFAVAVTVTGDPLAPDLWLSTAADVGSPSGVSALGSWSAGALLGFGDPGLALGPGTTGGTLTLVEDFDAQGQDGNVVLVGLHQVQSTITVGTGPSVTLQPGDLLFSVANNETFVNADLSTTGIGDKDVGLFRPAVPGDYGAGTFSVLLDQPLGTDSAVSLVESETILPDITLAAGTFLLTNAKVVYRLVPTGTGDAVSPGTPSVLLNGPDAGLDKNLTAIDLVEEWTVVGGTVLPAGTLLISMDGEDLVGSNSLSTTRRDVFALTLSATTAGSGTGAATAAPFFVGTDVGLDTNNESVAGFTIVGGTPATAPVAYDDAVGATQDWPAITRVLDNDVDPNGDPISLDSFSQGTNGTVTDNGDDTLTYTPDPGWTGVDAFTYTVTDGSETDTATVTVTVTPHSDPMAVWRRNGQSTPFYATWNGSAFSAGQATAVTGEYRMMQGAESPHRDEAIVVGVNNSNQVTAELWDGSAWTAHASNPLSSVIDSFWWGFDVAYESLSGDAIMVYNNGTTGTAGLSYRVWNGSTWNGPFTITTPLAGEPKQLQLAAHPYTDEMVLVVSNATSQDYAMVWNGSSWGNSQVLAADGTGNDRTDVYVAYEQQSGDALVVFSQGADTNVHSRVWTGSAWSNEFTQPTPGGAVGYPRWITLASDPNSDRIAMGVLANGADVWLATWTGSAFADTTVATTTASGTNHPGVAVAFEGTSGQALATYGEGVNTPRYRTWTSGSGWSGELSAPDIGANSNSMMLYTEPDTDGVMFAVQDVGSDLHYLSWNGSSWGSDNELDTNTAEVKNQPFLFLWNAPPTSTPVPVAADDAASTLADTAVVVDVVANDTDPIGDGLTIDSVTQGTNGSVVNNGTDVLYTPNASWTGIDTFTYTFSDTNGGTDTATVTVDVLEPVELDNIQKGTTTLAGGSATTTVTIAAVDPSRSFLTYSLRGDDSTPSDITINGVLTNPTTVTFSRVGTSNTVTIEWSVVEFVSGVTVQRGAEYVASGGPRNVAISPVDPSRSFVLSNVAGDGNAFGQDDFARATLTSPTNLRIDVGNGLGSTVAWQVIQYNEAVVQRGTTSFASGESAKTATVSSVDTSKSWLVYGSTTVDGTTNDIGQKLVRGLVPNGTTLTFDRSSTGQTLDVGWELVEFTDATEVRHGSVTVSSSETTRDVTITAVDPVRSIAVGGYDLFGGRTSYSADDNPGVGWFTTKLTAPTNLRVQRDTAPAGADLGWFVIHWPGESYSASGTVFEDVAGNVLSDGTVGDANNPGATGVDVHLYVDTDGDGIAEATDTYQTTVQTDVNGAYRFPGLYSGKYFVVVDSKTVRSTAPAISSNDVWPEQTYGPAVSECADGSGGTVNDPTPGPCYGGRRAGVSDNLATWYSGAEHLAEVSIASADETDIDFGFSFNVVTTIAGGDSRDDDPAANLRSVQGSLRQFITNANTITGANAMRFVPADPANATDGSHDWWRIPVTDLLPTVIDDATTIDGRAFDFTDGATVLDINTAQIGAGIAVGTEGTYTTPTLDPELEIWNNRGTAVLATGLVFEATDSVLRHVSIWGFGDSAGSFDTNVRFGTNFNTDPNFTGSLIEFNVIGTGPASFADPGVGNRSGQKNLSMRETDNAIVRDNLIGFAGGIGVDFSSASNAGTVLRNEVRGNGILDPNGNPVGVWINGTVTGNLIADNASGVFSGPTLWITYQDNTITANGWGGTRPHGIWVYGSPTTIRRNVIADNAGAGVVVQSNITSASITRNSMYGNGTVTGSIGIDLLSSGDNSLAAPFVTLNDDGDGDSGGNNLLNHPVFDTARIEGADLTLTGWSRPGTTIELYLADPDPSGFGEGRTWLISIVEGSIDDTDATTGTYGPGPINGIAQGTDTTNRFEFTIPVASLASPVSGADRLTALAVSGSTTSEFSGTLMLPPTFVVNSTGDQSDITPGDGKCYAGLPNSEGLQACTLRAAIEEANALSGADPVEFDIPLTDPGHSGGVWTIQPGSELPQLTDAVVIDATTQPGWTTTPVIELDGTSAGGSSDGLRIFSTDVDIRGFAINRFGADGIEVDTSSTGGVVIAGNHIGLDASGLIDRGNGGRGIDLQAGSGPTIVGGITPADRNVISGNGGDGIIVWNSSGNTIIGNYIGTDVTGNASGVGIGNGADGIAMGSTAAGNIIGQPGSGNVLSGNDNDGFENDATGAGNTVQANIIGLGADGATPVPNGRYGVVIYNGANNTTIGGPGAGDGNVISANVESGVVIDGNSNPATAGNTLEGNLIGTDATGLFDRGNGIHGVFVFGGAPDTTIGGSSAGAGNVIAANGGDGIRLQDAGTDDTIIRGNVIGFAADGSTPLGNGTAGIRATASDRLIIGGSSSLERNVVGNSASPGILLDGGTDTVIRGNYIGVQADGVTPAPNFDGIDVSGATGLRIGGAGANEGNVVSGNAGAGITLDNVTVGTQVRGNLIGVAADGATPAPNGWIGVNIMTGATATTIGGRGPGEANTIAHNGDDGVRALMSVELPEIIGNRIYENGGLGIDIGLNGVNPPDAGDLDGHPNQPTLLAARSSGGTTTVDIAFDRAAGDYIIDYYANPGGADPSGYGEGAQLIATAPVTTAGTGPVVLQHVLPGVGLTITATATSVATAETSEFSNAIVGVPATSGTLLDSTLRRSDLALVGGAASVVPGIAGDALDLDGTDDHLIGPGLDITDGSLSMSAWVRLDALGADRAVISKRAANGNVIYELAVDGTTDEAVATVRLAGAPVTARGGTLTIGAWRQLDAAWDGTELVLYVDGFEVDRVGAVGTLANDVTTDVTIGARSDGTNRIDGAVDHVHVGHSATPSSHVALRQTNLNAVGLVRIGDEQTGAAGAWTATTGQSRSGSYSLAAPETVDAGSAAWAVARDIDEPGLVFESWWWISQAADLDITAGTRAGSTPIDQYSGAAVDSPFGWELRQPSGDTEAVDAAASGTAVTGSWVQVEMWTDQLGDTRLFADGVEVIGWTSQGSALTSGSAGLQVDRLPTGEQWFVDDARARKLVTPEPVATLGPLQRN